jgi:hypothetical protein
VRESLELALVKDFPGIFRDHRGDPMKTCMAFGLDVGAGWEPLIRKLCTAIIEAGGDDVVADQVKEKWGSLRIYYHGGNHKVSALVEEAERQSAHVCEACGSVIDVECRHDKGGYWVRTLCLKCRGDGK